MPLHLNLRTLKYQYQKGYKGQGVQLTPAFPDSQGPPKYIYYVWISRNSRYNGINTLNLSRREKYFSQISRSSEYFFFDWSVVARPKWSLFKTNRPMKHRFNGSEIHSSFVLLSRFVLLRVWDGLSTWWFLHVHWYRWVSDRRYLSSSMHQYRRIIHLLLQVIPFDRG